MIRIRARSIRRALDGLDDDIRDHIERKTQGNLERGMAPDEARRQALLKFGNVAFEAERVGAPSSPSFVCT
jgi:putative ABC transport system permease protein